MSRQLTFLFLMAVATSLFAQDRKPLPTEPGPIGWAGNDPGRVYDLHQVDSIPRLGGHARLAKHCAPVWGDPACFEHTTVYLSFVVERDGTLNGIKDVGPACAELFEAAKCALVGRKGWRPGILKGKTVRTRLIIPILIPAVF